MGSAENALDHTALAFMRPPHRLEHLPVNSAILNPAQVPERETRQDFGAGWESDGCEGPCQMAAKSKTDHLNICQAVGLLCVDESPGTRTLNPLIKSQMLCQLS